MREIGFDPPRDLVDARRILRKGAEIELQRLRFDDRRRVGWHAEFTDRDLRLAARIEPRDLVRGPQIDAAEGQRRAQSERFPLARASDRKEQCRIVAFGVVGWLAERRAVERRHHLLRAIFTPR